MGVYVMLGLVLIIALVGAPIVSKLDGKQKDIESK